MSEITFRKDSMERYGYLNLDNKTMPDSVYLYRLEFTFGDKKIKTSKHYFTKTSGYCLYGNGGSPNYNEINNITEWNSGNHWAGWCELHKLQSTAKKMVSLISKQKAKLQKIADRLVIPDVPKEKINNERN